MKDRDRMAALEVGSIKGKALTAAGAILASHGAEELSLRAIADAAGIGLASIYHYFENKDDLLLNLALRGFDELRRDILKFRDEAQTLTPMRVGHQAFFRFAETRPALFLLMYDERLLARHDALRRAEYETFLAYQAAVKADDRIPAKHQENAAYALWALGRGMAALISSHPDAKLPPELSEKLFAGAVYLIDRPADDA